MASVASVTPAARSASAATTTTSRPPLGKGIRLTLFYLLLLVIAAVFITPYLFSAFAAFKTLPEILAQSPARPPTNPTWDKDRKSTRLNSSHRRLSRMPSSA